MAALVQISINFSVLNPPNDGFAKRGPWKFNLTGPFKCYGLTRVESDSSCKIWFKKESYYEDRLSFLGVNREEDGILLSGDRSRRSKRAMLVKFREGFGFNGGGGGGRDNDTTARVLGNLALAIGLTYLTMTGQLGWLLDAIVSVWFKQMEPLIAVLLPIVGLGAFLWWAGRDIVQSSCPNCGNEFQIFRSTLNEDLQLCPFCSQPFSVVGDEFIRGPVKFSNQSTTFGEAFNEFYPRSKKGKDSSVKVVDVEAEVKDAD